MSGRLRNVISLTAPAAKPPADALPVSTHHLERAALVYAPPADADALLAHVGALGWPRERVRVVAPEGASGAAFQGLLGEVISGRVGLLAAAGLKGGQRRSALEVCALFDVLFTEGAVAATPCTMSLREGRLRKALQGQLGKRVPTGYARLPTGEVILDPDPRVRAAVGLLFAAFSEEGTINGLLRRLAGEEVLLGFRRPGSDAVDWRRPNRQTLRDILRNPIFAGAYAYGRRRQGEGAGWLVCLRGRLPAYITWARYEENLAALASRRRATPSPSGRSTRSLLHGRMVCGRCGRRMATEYPSGSPRYSCNRARLEHGAPNCQSLAVSALDQAVLELVDATDLGDARARRRRVEQMIREVEVRVVDDTEQVELIVAWLDGGRTAATTQRPVARWEQMSTWPSLKQRLRTWKHEGWSARAMAERLNEESWRLPKRDGRFSAQMVRTLISRHQLGSAAPRPRTLPALGTDEWWLGDLARHLDCAQGTLYGWLRKGWLDARQLGGARGRWVVKADAAEVARLRALRNV